MTGTAETPTQQYGYHEEKDALIKRLHRIEGQVRGIERMVSSRPLLHRHPHPDRRCLDRARQPRLPDPRRARQALCRRRARLG